MISPIFIKYFFHIKKIKIIKDPSRYREIDADLQIPDVKKFKNHTGWKPKYKFKGNNEGFVGLLEKFLSKNKKF